MGKISAQLPIGSDEWKIARCVEGHCPMAACVREQCPQGYANLRRRGIECPEIQPGVPGDGPKRT
jgi:hypothetical protein